MTAKEIALKTITTLHEEASGEAIQKRINFVVVVRKGLAELDGRPGIPHEKVN